MSIVLYLMGFVSNFWEEIISYKLGGNQKMGIKFNSLSMILHKALD